MAEIESQIVAGRYAIACRDLDQLLAWKSDPNGGIVYLLGSCELARGRNEAADEAWERVVPGSEFSERAIRGRMRLSIKPAGSPPPSGSSTHAAEDPRNDRTALLILLVPMLGEQGRTTRPTGSSRPAGNPEPSGRSGLEPAIKLVRLHIDLTLKPTPVEAIRSVLDRAARLAPDDDRVWLGRANLAIRTGAFDEAGR